MSMRAAHEGRITAARERRHEKVAEILLRHTQCRCGMTPDITDRDLAALDGGCTSPQFVCPCLDSVRRAVRKSE